MELDDTCTKCHSALHFKMLSLTWQGGHRNHDGGFSALCCTLSALTPDISPNFGNLTVLSMLVGGRHSFFSLIYIVLFCLLYIYIYLSGQIYLVNLVLVKNIFNILNIVNYFKMAAQEGAKSSRAFLCVERAPCGYSGIWSQSHHGSEKLRLEQQKAEG